MGVSTVLEMPSRSHRAYPAKSRQRVYIERVVAMKSLLLGMMFCMAAGAETFILIPDGPITLQQQFMFGLICGTIGTVVGLAMWPIPLVNPVGKPVNPLQEMARQAVANLGLAAGLAPTVAWGLSGISGIPITVPFLAPIAMFLGIGGSAWFAKVWPWFLEWSSKKAKERIRQVAGDVPDDADDTK